MRGMLTTGPSPSSSSPSHLFVFFTSGLTVTTAVVGALVSSSEASQSDIAKPTQRMRRRKGKSKKRVDGDEIKTFGRFPLLALPRVARSAGVAEHPTEPAMTSATRDALLKLALPLVENHGFTRSALSLATMYLPSGKHAAPLNDTAIDALFGEGDEARRTLINAWLDDARISLRKSYTQCGAATPAAQTPSLGSVLKARLSKNEEVLKHLPEVSARLDPVFPLFKRDSEPFRHSLSSLPLQHYPHSFFL